MEYCGLAGEAELKEMVVTISNRLEEIAELNSKFEQFATTHRLSDRLRRRMKMVFDELLSNTISYAYPQGGNHSITIRVALVSTKLEVTVTDDGIPFNPFALAEPNTKLAIEDREVGGLGVHLVRNVMDEVGYTRRTEKNVVSLIKHLDSN